MDWIRAGTCSSGCEQWQVESMAVAIEGGTGKNLEKVRGITVQNLKSFPDRRNSW